MASQEQLEGEVERLVYSSDESGFTICRLKVPGKDDLVGIRSHLHLDFQDGCFSLGGPYLGKGSGDLQISSDEPPAHLVVGSSISPDDPTAPPIGAARLLP